MISNLSNWDFQIMHLSNGRDHYAMMRELREISDFWLERDHEKLISRDFRLLSTWHMNLST